MKFAIIGVFMIYLLPHVLHPTPRTILTAREFLTTNAEQVVAEVSSLDAARAIKGLIEQANR